MRSAPFPTPQLADVLRLGRQITVAAANPRTIVVVNAGSPVTMDWASEPAAVLQCWLPGEEWGNALADVLLGDREPGGRLPTTFPVRVEDAPSHATYPGIDGHVTYADGLLMGYRGFESGVLCAVALARAEE